MGKIILLVIAISSNGHVETGQLVLKDQTWEACEAVLQNRALEKVQGKDYGSIAVCTYEESYRTVGLGAPISTKP